jgi:hypothetical protein
MGGVCKSTLMDKLFDDSYEWTRVNLNDEYLKFTKSTVATVKDYDMSLITSQDRLLDRIVSGIQNVQKTPDVGIFDCEPANRMHSTSSNKKPVATYGGFGELRTDLWNGFEPCICGDSADVGASTNKRKCTCVMLHLGVDFNNLKPGTLVKSICDGYVAHIMDDNKVDTVDGNIDKDDRDNTASGDKNAKTKNGWGGRVIVYDTSKRLYVLYGHLDPKTLPALGMCVERGQYLSTIGSQAVNGGWFCHLHLQVMTSDYVSKFPNLDLLDGYDLTRSTIPDGVLDPFEYY